MSRFLLKCCGLLLACSLSAPLLADGKCELLVATGSPDRAPYLWRDPADPGHLIGAEADLLFELATALQIQIQLLPAPQGSSARDEVASGRMDLLLGAGLDEQGLAQFDYLYPAYAESRLQVWSLEENAPLFGRLQDLASHRGRLLAASLPVQLQGQLKLKRSRDLAGTRRQLLGGRLDYVIAEQALGQALLAPAQALQPALAADSLQLALSHDSACNDGWLRGQLSLQLRRLQAEGRFAGILRKAGQRWRASLQQD